MITPLLGGFAAITKATFEWLFIEHHTRSPHSVNY